MPEQRLRAGQEVDQSQAGERNKVKPSVFDTTRCPMSSGPRTGQPASVFASLRPLFVESASIEAIEAELQKAERQERDAAAKVNDLMKLAHERHMQIKEGTWPK